VIGYLDTSAIVPLLVAEPSSAACRRFWDDADIVVTSRLAYVETAAALAQARRLDRISSRTHRGSLRTLDALWAEIAAAEVDDQLVRDAAELARRHNLRGYGAVHCASARQLAADDLVAAAGDRQLLQAWLAIGVDTYDTNQLSAEPTNS
jgi:predicted nucleic acid-binding protein